MFPVLFLPHTFWHLDQLSWPYAPAVVAFRRIYLFGPLLPLVEFIYAGLRFRGAESDGAALISFVCVCLTTAVGWFLWTMAVFVSIFFERGIPL
jgi:hypothetical protein